MSGRTTFGHKNGLFMNNRMKWHKVVRPALLKLLYMTSHSTDNI